MGDGKEGVVEALEAGSKKAQLRSMWHLAGVFVCDVDISVNHFPSSPPSLMGCESPLDNDDEEEEEDVEDVEDNNWSRDKVKEKERVVLSA